MMSLGTQPAPKRSSFGRYILVGGVTFVAGVAATLSLSTWLQSGQTDALARLAEQVEQLQQTQATVAPEVTRAAPTESLALPVLDEPAVEAAVAEVIAEPTPAPEVEDLVVDAVAAEPAAIEPEVTEVAAVATIPSATQALAEQAEEASLPVDESVQDDRVAEALAAVHRNKMRMLTEGVLAGLYTVTSEETEEGGTRIAIDARNARTTTAEIEDLLEQAHADGNLELPEQIATADGELDTSTLIFDLVQRSLEARGEEGQQAAVALQQQAFAASQAQTEVEAGERFYTVEQGDSLAYIALQFYGSPNEYQRIFEANANILSSPDRIRTGQRLLIPDA